MPIYVNRTLNLKKIKAIGFDMDYTIVRYHTENFERLAYNIVIKKLIEKKGYPADIQKLKFDFRMAIPGLVIDEREGTVLKLSRFGKVKSSYQGTKPMDFKKQQQIYSGCVIDLADSHIKSLDTSFSIAHGVLFMQLSQLKEEGVKLPGHDRITNDLKKCLDEAHCDGSIKDYVRDHLSDFIIQDPKVAQLMERLKRHGKQVLIITNSDYAYTKLLLDYAINPFLKEHKDWKEVFDVTITKSMKPKFFIGRDDFLKIDPATGLMSNHNGKIERGGIYQGGNATQLQNDFGIEGEDILYLGDHIYGDVVSLKKRLNWRTALVVEQIEDEIKGLRATCEIQKKIDDLMAEKEIWERRLTDLHDRRMDKGEKTSKADADKLFAEIEKIDDQIAKEIPAYQAHFNPYWGELMRAGNEESLFMGQVEKYACIYMGRITDLLEYSPRTYFRPPKRVMPHEIM